LKPDLAVLLTVNALMILACLLFAIFVYPKRELSEETKRRSRSWVSNAFFREFWYFLMAPLKRKFLEWNVRPDAITWWGFIFSIAASWLFATGQFGFGAWGVVLSATCDVYDGQLARARNVSLKSGSFLDSVLDRLGELAMFFGLLWFFRASNFWYVVLFLTVASSQVTSYARARAEGLGFSGSRGFFQRAERMIVLSIGMGFTPLIDFLRPGWGFALVELTLLCLCAGSVQTAFVRCASIYSQIRASER
jgi:CDP-diacylglycerol--glycerol-3-phosphate 3-phosphatidyltransferase